MSGALNTQHEFIHVTPLKAKYLIYYQYSFKHPSDAFLPPRPSRFILLPTDELLSIPRPPHFLVFSAHLLVIDWRLEG